MTNHQDNNTRQLAGLARPTRHSLALVPVAAGVKYEVVL